MGKRVEGRVAMVLSDIGFGGDKKLTGWLAAVFLLGGSPPFLVLEFYMIRMIELLFHFSYGNVIDPIRSFSQLLVLL